MNRTAAIALSTLIAGPALAGGLDAPVTTPVVAAPVVMAAPVVSDWTGAYAGLSLGTGTVGAERNGTSQPDADLTTYGLFGGYNYDMGRAVIGGELSYDRLDIDVANADDDNGVVRLMARAGYDAGMFMPYVTAGFASMKNQGVSDNGYAYGVGADVRVGTNFVVGAQYLRHEFEEFDDSGIDYNADQFAIRAAYKF